MSTHTLCLRANILKKQCINVTPTFSSLPGGLMIQNALGCTLDKTNIYLFVVVYLPKIYVRYT